jgi:hypothetical protein
MVAAGLELQDCDQYAYDRYQAGDFGLEVLDSDSPGPVDVDLLRPVDRDASGRGDGSAGPSGRVDQAVANATLIPQTRIPVLLAGTDNDGVMPGEANTLELAAWQELCDCDVSQFVLTDTGHAFMAHRSLTEWTDNVVAWLIDRGIEPTT